MFKDRIKQLRKHYNLSQQEFGNRIGVSLSAISALEIGRNSPSEQTLMLICREFHANIHWLKTGEGEMLLPEEADESAALAAHFGFAELCAKALHTFDTLSPDQQDAVLVYARRYAASLLREDPQLVAAQLLRPSAEEAARKALAERLKEEKSSGSEEKQA